MIILYYTLYITFFIMCWDTSLARTYNHFLLLTLSKVF